MNNFVYGPAGEVLTALNSGLIERMKVTPARLEAIKLSHQLRWLLFKAAEVVLKEPVTDESTEKLCLLADSFHDLELRQQKLWGFEVNSNYCRFFDFPGCTCPKYDNADRIGTKYSIIAQDCRIHGGKSVKLGGNNEA